MHPEEKDEDGYDSDEERKKLAHSEVFGRLVHRLRSLRHRTIPNASPPQVPEHQERHPIDTEEYRAAQRLEEAEADSHHHGRPYFASQSRDLLLEQHGTGHRTEGEEMPIEHTL